MKYQKRTNKFGLGGGGHRYKRTCIRKGKCTLKRGRPMFSFTCNSNRKLNGRPRNRLKICISKFKLNYKINKAKQQPCFDSEYDIVYRDANYLKAILKKKKLPTQNGYRFIDLQQMQSFISQVTMHSISCERAVEIALKGISPYTDLTEIKSYGIACILGIKCKGCNYIHTMNTSSRLQTSKDKINRFDVNVRAVWGCMVTGNGASHLNELLGTMNSPGLRQATFGSIEEEIGQMWHTVLEEEMLAAGAEERRIAIENNNYNEGVPSITVIADGGWSKRSHKHTYNASGGVAIIVGKQTGKILYIGVRNKYCYICSRALNTQTEPPEHVCFKNWSASSQAMESDILVEGFKQAEKVHGLRYMQLIADGDSSVYAKIQEEVPVWGKFVTKMECSNHACKCLRSNLEKLVNDNPNYKGQNKLTKTTRVKIVSAVRCAIRMRSKESNRSAAIKLLTHDIRNSVHHIFGNHKNCSNFCKANEKRNETSTASSDNLSTNDIPDIFESQSLLWSEGTSLLAQEESRFSSNLIYTDLDKQMLSDITVLLNRLATKSERLVGNDTTNIAESWMHVRSKFDGGKFYNLCNRGSWHARCYGAAARQNLGPAWAPQVWSKTTGNEAGFYFKTVYNRRKKHLINTKNCTNKPEQKTRRWKRKMKSWTDSTTKKARYEYGPDSMEVTKDVEKLELDQLKDNYISQHIELTHDQILAIERQTKTQSNSQVWKTERKKRLTASNFGKIVKRNTKLKIKPLVSELLYSGFKGNAYTVKGLQEERNSIHEYILKKAESGLNVNVESSGLIIDKNHKFLACSPDGLVNENGEMGVIEIKNILQKKNMSFIQATKKVSNFCLQFTDEKVQLKKKHNYYFQCQGLLNISGLPWLDFIARSTSPYQIHIERIYRDEVLWNDTMLPKLEAFYFLALLPELAAPRYNKSPGIREPGDWVLLHNLGNPHGIAVNWVGKHIYWTDSHTRKIEMANFEGKQRRSVISSALDQPYYIVVHPEKGKLFWTDRGFPPKIESSNLDGSGRKIVINEEIIWPNGLAIDYPNGRLYWADTKKRTIETVDLEGKDRHVVIQFNTSTGTLAPYMVDVFEDYLFVSFYHNSTVMKIKKFRTNPHSFEDGHPLFKTLLSIGDILILQPSKQKLIDNHCSITELHCPSAMCINMPQESMKKYKCVCPDGARYIDEKCDFSTCLPGHCYNGGTCNISNTGPKCICPPGYNGTRCNNYICNNYCQNGGQCMIHDGKHICRCPEMFTGPTCSEHKNPSLCKGLCENGGTCIIMNGRRTCKCQKGFTGTRCEQCTSLMCYNGGTCRHSDSNSLQQTCVNGDCYIKSAVYCVCQSGYDPDSQCSTASCKNYTCSVNQVCKLDKEGLPQCVCKEGYTGDKCDPPVVESHCEKGCKNGGTCKLKANSIDYACSCPPHYGGTYCQTAENKCAGHCLNNGTCLLVNDSPKCSCNEYFKGSKCETCLCLNKGICKSDQNKFYCSCPGNYSGKLCNASACGNYCFNDGQCTKCSKDSSTGRYKCSACSCTNGFGGERCETHASAHSQAQSSDTKQMITIVVPVVIGVVLILVILLIVILYRRRRDQFKHQRMHNSNMEINNPIYRQPVDGEIEGQGSEIEPLDMEGVDHNTNFANPMYARLYTTDSTQVLLPKDSDSEEALDKNGDLNFYGSKGNPKKSNF